MIIRWLYRRCARFPCNRRVLEWKMVYPVLVCSIAVYPNQHKYQV